MFNTSKKRLNFIFGNIASHLYALHLKLLQKAWTIRILVPLVLIQEVPKNMRHD